VFEAIFGWRQAGQTLAELAGGLLHRDLVRALGEAQTEGLSEDYRFPGTLKPYRHQIDAWQALAGTHPARSVLVTSGTGSGKTECFLIPILDDLCREFDERQGHPLVGVRALFLYPLNALIKSQQDRLVAWSEPFKGKLRFCLYNGDTPDQAPVTWRSQVPDRRTLRTQPPPILVTNATMLEYLLVRGEDRPILEQSKGCLRWIVVDEAHSYIGSQAAELALLLRRVVHAFGVRAENVHFIATSATLGDSGEASRGQLAEFLADVGGLPLEQVSVIEGTREVPPLAAARQTQSLTGLADLQALTPAGRYAALAESAPARDLRAALVERPRRLADLTARLRAEGAPLSPRQTLALLDLCSDAVNDRGLPFLPLRGHLFHRTLSGLWACANRGCAGRARTLLDAADWPFGAVFLERRLACPHCGFPVFEVVQCGECGAEYLSAEEYHADGEDRLRPRDDRRDEDEFQEELEPPEGDDADGAIAQAPAAARARLLGGGPDPQAPSPRLSAEGVLHWGEGDGVVVQLRTPKDHGCALCREREREHSGITLFRPMRVGAPFLLGTAIPTLFEHLSKFPDSREARPLDGRRLISFTDSRQGTARFATRLQQEAERNYVRSLLYHSLAAARGAVDHAQVERLRAEVATLEGLAGANVVLVNLLADRRKELAKLQTPTSNCLPWMAAEDKLLQSDDFTRFLLPALRDLTYDRLDDRRLARLCLLREFFVRPRRQFSLEGLGLVQLRYPAMEKAEPPAVMRALGVAPEEWRALLQVAVDYFIRSGSPAVAATLDLTRWLGYPGRPSWQLPPDQARSRPSQRTWPSACGPFWRRNRLVRLVGRAFRLDPADPEGCQRIDEILRAIWDGIGPVLTQQEDGFQLELENRVELAEVRAAWLCPMTGRLLPEVFRDLTPYLPGPAAGDALARAIRVEMPEVPTPFWPVGADPQADDWLESDPRVRALRDLGAWTDISDRIARHSRFFLAKEHSAQLSGNELTRREDAFKAGKLNLLSCSTTMEMGVDIGGLTAVAMNNVPPHPANFLQRAGRAGRRGENRALSFTLCKSTPQGEAVFRDPTWPFTTPLALPRVALQSEPIVQRHLNALALARFLVTRTDRIHRLRVGWFFEVQEGQSSPADRFADWCEGEAEGDDSLRDGLTAVARRTVLAGLGVKSVLARTAAAVRRTGERWRGDLDALLAQEAAVHTQDGKSVAERAIGFQLRRLREDYLLGELADLAFLPGYGFPTDVVPFVTTTIEDLVNAQNEEREDNRARRAGYPSRNLAIAIRDYAPGIDTVLDGRVYRSGGVTLNWQLPVDAGAAPEIQDLRWVWRCRSCGDSGTRAVRPAACPACGAGSERITLLHYLQPSGFAVDLRERPHNDVSLPQYIPVRDPLISLAGAPWMNLPEPRLGRYRNSTEGHLFQHSEGLHGTGFALCLRCGRADSLTPQGEVPTTLDGHKRLRGGRLNDKERACPGNAEPWAIQRPLALGVAARTDVFELQLRHPISGCLPERAAAYTLGVALRRALCRRLGIEEGEVGAAALPSRDQEDLPGYSVYLFDNASGGAGYATQAPTHLPALLRDAHSFLECPRGCDNACQACVLTYDSQHQIEHLNRQAALELVSRAFLDALELPPALRAFGERTSLEMEPLPLALGREWQRMAARQLRIHLGGEPRDWEPLDWSLRQMLARVSESEVAVSLVIPSGVLAALQPSQRGELAILAGFTRARLLETATPATAGGLPLCLELGAEGRSTRWAVSDAAALAPSPTWGSGSRGASFVRAAAGEVLPLPPGAREFGLDELRPSAPDLAEVRILEELDGSSAHFGERAWGLLQERVPTLAALLAAGPTLQSVRYSDRYLRSPLALHLLGSLLGALGRFPGGIGSSTAVTVVTARLERLSPQEPQAVGHDWRDAEDRRQVAAHLLGDSPGVLAWLDDEGSRRLPHARELELTWPNGTRLTLRLDQGLGYWRGTGGASGFPFSADPKRQVKVFCDLRLRIGAVSHSYPTYWYVAVPAAMNG
jgi:DEAD/DEAH box helicase domain-containing protein